MIGHSFEIELPVIDITGSDIDVTIDSLGYHLDTRTVRIHSVKGGG
jgi:hypothetical protein